MSTVCTFKSHSENKVPSIPSFGETGVLAEISFVDANHPDKGELLYEETVR